VYKNALGEKLRLGTHRGKPLFGYLLSNEYRLECILEHDATEKQVDHVKINHAALFDVDLLPPFTYIAHDSQVSEDQRVRNLSTFIKACFVMRELTVQNPINFLDRHSKSLQYAVNAIETATESGKTEAAGSRLGTSGTQNVQHGGSASDYEDENIRLKPHVRRAQSPTKDLPDTPESLTEGLEAIGDEHVAREKGAVAAHNREEPNDTPNSPKRAKDTYAALAESEYEDEGEDITKQADIREDLIAAYLKLDSEQKRSIAESKSKESNSLTDKMELEEKELQKKIAELQAKVLELQENTRQAKRKRDEEKALRQDRAKKMRELRGQMTGDEGFTLAMRLTRGGNA
jgi:hypothetical protein